MSANAIGKRQARIRIPGRRRRTALIGLCAGLLVPCAGRGQVAPPAIQKGPFALPAGSSLPVTLLCRAWRGLPLVEGSVNDKTQRFLVDTGLNAVSVSPSVRSDLKLPPTKRIFRVSVMENTINAPGITLKSLALGPLVFHAGEASVVNVAGILSAQHTPDTPQCWIGTPLLMGFQTTIDLEKGELRLEMPKTALPNAENAISLPLILRNGRIYTRLTLPKVPPFLMLIDTGSPASILPLTVFDKLKIKPYKTLAVTLANRRKARAAQLLLPELRLGETPLKNQPVVSIASDDPKDFDPEFGLIGMDILSHYRFTINYARKRMVLISNIPPAEKPEKPSETPLKLP